MDERTPAVDFGSGIGQVVGNGLKRAQRLIELLALFRILHGHLESTLCASHGPRGLQDDSLVHHRIPCGPTGPRISDAVGQWNAHVLEIDSILGIRTDGLLLGQGDPVELRIDQEKIHILFAITGSNQHDPGLR